MWLGSSCEWVWSNIGECLLQGSDLPSEVNGKPATMQSLGLVEEVSTYSGALQGIVCIPVTLVLYGMLQDWLPGDHTVVWIPEYPVYVE